jgi:hypothetical protein
MFPPAMSNISVLLAAEPSTIKLNIMVALLIAFVMLLLSSKSRTFAVILLGSLLVLGVLGLFAYRFSEAPRANQMVQLDLPQSAVQISHTNYGNGTISVSAPNVLKDNQIVGQPAIQWPIESQTPSFEVITSTRPTWFAFGILAIFGLLLLGGLVFIITMLSIPKTRTLGIVLLVVGSIIILPTIAGLFWVKSYSPIPTTKELYPESHSALVAETMRQQQPEIPLPPGYSQQAPMVKHSQSQQQKPAPNSKQMAQAYQSAIQYYSKAISLPLKLDIKDDLKDKVSTLKINVQDLGQVTISGSSFLINSIGQALAKAMTERLNEGNPQINITPENSTTLVQEAASPANNISERPALAGASVKKEISAKEPPVKDVAAETAKAPPPTANAVESAAPANAVSADTKNIADAPERPDWIDKKPFPWLAGNRAKLPDYYKIMNSKPVDGDAYIITVTTGPYTTLQECEDKIPDVIQSAVDQFAEKYLRRNWGEYVHLSPDQLRQFIVADYEEPKDFSFGKMNQIHLLLNFDKKAKTLIDETINVRMLNNRAALVGTGFVGLWLLLAVFWAYLKLDLSTQGGYRKRLRAAAGFAILIIVTMGFLVLRTLA